MFSVIYLMKNVVGYANNWRYPQVRESEVETSMNPMLLLDRVPLLRIFLFAIEDSPHHLQKITLVSRSWRKFANEELYRELYQRIAPDIIRKEDYIEQVNGDPGIELPIPFEYMLKFKRGRTLLTFVPENLTFTQDDGVLVVEPCNFSNMRKWVVNSKKGIGFHPDSAEPNMNDNDEPGEGAHWSFIDLRVLACGQDFVNQEDIAKMAGGVISELLDTSISLLMTCRKTGIRYLSWGLEDSHVRWVRVQEMLVNLGFYSLSFPSEGLFIKEFSRDDLPSLAIGIVVAQSRYIS